MRPSRSRPVPGPVSGSASGSADEAEPIPSTDPALEAELELEARPHPAVQADPGRGAGPHGEVQAAHELDPASRGDRLVVGLVRGVHGLRGAIRIEPLTDDPERFSTGTRLAREGDTQPLTIDWVQADGPGYLVRFREVSDREGATALRGVYLEGDASTPLPEGEYYWHEVVGARVCTTDGEELGRVAEIFRAGGAEVYAVRGGQRGELLVPAVRSIVRTFQPREGLLEVDAEALGLEEIRPRRPRGRVSSKTAG